MIKKNTPPLLSLLLLLSAPVFAQHSLSGTVVDNADAPVAYANVILLNAEDSTSVVRGAVTSEEGVFKFNKIEANEYLLKVSFVGFEDYLGKMKVSEDKKIGKIILEETAANLDEVSINVKNPSIKRETDRLIFEVENTTLSRGSSWDILKKTPMVLLVNDNLQVRNQPVDIYINDRKVQLSASELQVLLENYSAENIRSVEVITNPPSRYDAEGGAILNIVTSKSINPGYKGSLNAALTQAVYPKATFGTSHYLKTEKLIFFANYSFNPRKEFKKDDSYINFMENGQIFSRWNTDFERTTRSNAHNANVILDYLLNERNTLSFSSNVVYSPGKTFDNDVFTDITNVNEPDFSFRTGSHLEEDQSNIGLDVEYRHLLEKEGAQISAKAHYTRYDQDRQQEVNTNYFDNEGGPTGNNSFFTDAQQGINIFTGQVDYMGPLGTSNFETGVKAAVIDSESGIDYYNIEDVSDNFLYDENIFAGYLTMSKDWDAWSAKAGLRGELTNREGTSLSTEQVDTRNYFELFPTFYLQHTLSKNHSLTFDYSRRIQRPRYENLNPFSYFLNEHNFNTGNPNLHAAISNNFNLNYSLKNQYFFDVYYRDNGPSTETLSFQDNEELNLRNVSINLLESFSYGLDISHGRSLTGFWYAYAYVSFFHDEQTFLALESNNARVTNEVDGFFGTVYNSFTLSKDRTFSGELSFTYVSDWITGSYDFDPMTTLSLGLRKTLWNNRAELSVNLEDILERSSPRLTSRYLNQDNSFWAQPETRYIRVGFKYNFGNFRLSDNERAVEAEERDRL